MNRFRVLHRRYATLAGLLAVFLSFATGAGCAKMPWTSSVARDISPVRETRGAEATQKFEAFRNQAQFQAACARWQDGDAKTCEQMLLAVLQRVPDHYAARQTLADLYAATERPELAEQELQKLLERDPHDPQVHHSLGLLLESTGRTREALAHVRQAVQLDAQNELYSASEATMLAATQPAPAAPPLAAKTSSPKLASLREVTPRIADEPSIADKLRSADSPRSRVKPVAFFERKKSSEPTLTTAPTLPAVSGLSASTTKKTAVSIAHVELDDTDEESSETLRPPAGEPECGVSTASHPPAVLPVVHAAPEPISESDDKPPAIHFRVESK